MKKSTGVFKLPTHIKRLSVAAAIAIGATLALPAWSQQASDDQAIADQTAKVDCSVYDIAAHINQGDPVVPAVIYHFGERAFMDEIVAERTISQHGWDKYIMGDITRYKLEKVRRGFYGTAGIDTNGFGYEPYNWLIEIHIKDECRAPENVVTLIDLPTSKRFIAWFKSAANKDKSFSSVKDFATQCYYLSVPNMQYTGVFYTNSTCSNFVNSYLESSNAKIVQDHIIRKSFYIRDRACIETIKGTPAEVIDFALKRDFLWKGPCEVGNVGLPMFSSIVTKALSEEASPSQADVDAIRQRKLSVGIGY